MGKVELPVVAEVALDVEAKPELAPATQGNTIGSKTQSSLLGKIHRYVSVVIVPEWASFLKGFTIVDRPVGLSRVS